jgi:ACS family hexuronate transporter-like MFS transporter
LSRRTRWVLLALISLAFVINFIDRQTLSTVAPLLRDELHLTNSDYSVIVASFLLGMAIFQVPIGSLMDRVGPKAGFAIIFIWWSVASAAHAFARTAAQFCGLRFLLGAAECGSYSGGLKSISQWFPAEERALAGGAFNSAIFVGAVAAPPLAVWLTLHYSWHAAFLVPGTVGLLWLVAWLGLFPRPGATAANRGSNAPGAQSALRVSTRTLLGKRQTWGVLLVRSLGAPVFHFYSFWLPEYLKRQQHIDLAKLGAVVWIPFAFAGLGNLLGGWLSGYLLRRGCSLTFSRRLPYILGDGLAAASNMLIMFVPSLSLVIIVLSIANMGANLVEANFIALIGDIFPESTVGRVTGITGVGDNVMSITVMLTAGLILDRFSYLPIFMGASLLLVLQIVTVIWLIGPVKRVDLGADDLNQAGGMS